jgi:hypothetical protein
MVDNTLRLELTDLKERHAGRRAFILGNGPSLRIEDLRRLENEITFACNKIYLAFPEIAWRPTYYTVEDHLVALQNWDEIEAMEGSIKFFPSTLGLHGINFSNSIEYPFIWKDVYPELPGFSDDAQVGLYWGSTVTYTMLQMAFYMGINEIYLMGVDFSFVIPKQWDDTEGKFKVYICEGETNHFHPDYRKPGERWHQPNLAYQEKSFLAAKIFAGDRNVKIFNATRGGRLEVFPRADFDAVLGT